LPDVVRAHPALDRLADSSGNLLIRALAVGELRDGVEQRRKLYDLAVRAARNVRGLLEARPLVLTDQLDAVGKLRLLGRRAVGRRSLIGYGKDFGLLFFRGRDGRLPL
jgi:hypothetical protein